MWLLLGGCWLLAAASVWAATPAGLEPPTLEKAGPSASAGELEIRFLDVGQGDATLIRHAGKTVLVDTGPSDVIVDTMHRLKVATIDLLVVTHNHSDHLGGADAVLAAFPVRHYLDNGWPAKTKLQEVVLRLLERRGVTYLNPTTRTIRLGDAALRIIPPPREATGDDQNEVSVGLVLDRQGFRLLLPGDAGPAELKFWLQTDWLPTLTILKAAHHGSRTGVTPEFLHRTRPALVLISCGAGNRFGHPHASALRYYQSGGRRVVRTDTDGEVTVWVDANGGYRVITTRGRAPSSSERSPTPDRPCCCRICRSGKACGDACIARDRQCTHAPGCACDG